MRKASRVTLAAAGIGSLALTVLLAAGAPVGAQAAGGAQVQPHAGHVFLIELENKGFNEAYVTNPNPYLRKTLPAQGQLLTNYYGIGHVSLDNYVAQLSGQAPNLNTQSDCQNYTDFQPSTAVIGPGGQAAGIGCVYPTQVKALPDQLTATGHSWKAYLQDMGNDQTREDDRCGAPANSFGTGGKDGTQSATARDQYAARHNPFIYFHSIRDSELCHTNVVPLDQLAGDLTQPANFTWISPNLCSDGHDDPCTGKNVAGGSAGGLKAIDLFLAKYVPMIEASPAFKKDGVLIITSDEAENNDATACCGEKPGPNSPFPGITGPGGGRIGTVVIGHCVTAGSRNATPYNHYALLRSLEDNFGITTGGADGKGHLGYAGAAGLKAFGADVFGGCNANGQASAASGIAGTGPSGGGAAGNGSESTGGGGPPGGSGSGSTGGGAQGGSVEARPSSSALATTGGLPLTRVAAGFVLLAGITTAACRRRKAG